MMQFLVNVPWYKLVAHDRVIQLDSLNSSQKYPEILRRTNKDD